MEAQEYDELKASACKLGADIAAIASEQTKTFLQDELFKKEALMDVLSREMKYDSKFTNEEVSIFLKLLAEGF